jgi:hypothetical protein
MAGLVPATHEHRILHGAPCCATRGTLNSVEATERGAGSRATLGFMFMGGRHKAGHDDYFCEIASATILA